jgi:DNA-binding beta-propeller fold protein YncE
MGRDHPIQHILIACLLLGVAWPGLGQGPEDKSGDRKSRPLGSVQGLVKKEERSPTTADNAERMFKVLSRVAARIRKEGGDASEVLSREDRTKIRDLIDAGDLEEAAELVHEAIMSLADVSPEDDAGQAKTDRGRKDKKPAALDKERPRPKVRKKREDAALFVNDRIDFHRIASVKPHANLLKLMNPVVDSERRRLYLTGTRTTTLAIVDLDTDELIDSVDIGVMGGFLVMDQKTGELYLFQFKRKNFYKLDPVRGVSTKLDALPASVALPKQGTPKKYNDLAYLDSGHPFKQGYLQKENASYGVIRIRNKEGKQVDSILHGPAGLYFDIDRKTGKLYATNTGDSTISVFDLNDNNRKIKDIDIGTSVEEVLIDPETGNLYARNRLGGSTILVYGPSGVAEITNENAVGEKGIAMWPTQMIRNSRKLYVLSHYGGVIDVVDLRTHEVTGRIPLELTYKPRSDAVSVMAMNRTTGMLFAAFPELGEVAIADAGNMKWVQTLEIQELNKNKTGPARVSLAVDEPRNRLFVYLADEGILNVYGGNKWKKEKSIEISAGRKEHSQMVCNSEKGLLYLGDKILDVETLRVKSTFRHGSKVVGFDNSSGRVYLVGAERIGPARQVERVYEFKGMTLEREWSLSPILLIHSSFYFDFKNSKFYAGYFESGVVESFEL